MTVNILTSPIGGPDAVPLPYTSSPFRLLWDDIILFFKLIVYVPGILFPLSVDQSGNGAELNELSPNLENIFEIFFQVLLFLLQACFIISLPFCITLPMGLVLTYAAVFKLINTGLCRVLNGSKIEVMSTVDLGDDIKHDDECWIFLNGVCVGRVIVPSVTRTHHLRHSCTNIHVS